MSHLSKGWSICQKGGPFVKRCGPFVKRVVHLSKGVPERSVPILLRISMDINWLTQEIQNDQEQHLSDPLQEDVLRQVHRMA